MDPYSEVLKSWMCWMGYQSGTLTLFSTWK